jgi:hypothetical protein
MFLKILARIASPTLAIGFEFSNQVEVADRSPAKTVFADDD